MSSPLADRPCATCGSANHGTGAHPKLRELYVDRLQELRTTREELAPGPELDGLLEELRSIEAGLSRLDRRPSELS